MLRFVHTADWQIGMKAESAGRAAAKVRAERFEAARRVVQTAQEHKADFIVVAGDVFEDNAVDRTLVQRTADVLDRFGGPVFVIPGNHDPLVPGSVWDHPAWRQSGSIRVLREEEPVAGDGYTVYPCPLREKYGRKDPTAWVDAHDGEGIRIGIAHGTVEGIAQDEPDYPIPRDAAARAGLDYLALGHWHSTAPYPGPDGAARMAYSGTHEPTKFGERDSGNVLLVELDARGAPPRLTPLRTGGLTWRTLSVESREAGDLGRARIQVEQFESPERALLDVRLTGLLYAEERGEPDRIRELLDARFLFGRLDADGLRPSPADADWMSSLPPGILKDAATRLQAMASAEGSDERTRAEAARALVELYAIAGEDRR